MPLHFLQQVRAASQGGGLLIGVDLVKPLEILEPAYDDALGVTAAFNKNLLLHLNRLMGCDFDLADWSHVAFFNPASRASKCICRPRVICGCSGPARNAISRRGERIHTENSYKYTVAGF